jgi:transcription antitermination factor NusG
MTYAFLKESERIKVVRGPLSGCVGIFDRVDPKNGRLVVNLAIFKKRVSVKSMLRCGSHFNQQFPSL